MNSIKRTLGNGLTGSILLWLVAVSILLYASLRGFIVEHFDDIIETKALALLSYVESTGQDINPNRNSPLLEHFNEADAIDHFRIYKENGQIYSESASAPAELVVPADLQEDLRRGSPRVEWDIDPVNGDPGRAVAIREAIVDAEGNHEYFTVVSSTLRDDRAIWIQNVFFTIVACSGLLGIVLVAVIQFTIAYSFRSLDQLEAEIQEVDDNTNRLSPLSRAGVPRELLPIVNHSNALFDRVNGLIARERRITRSIAHEFRTPIAELRSMTEVALQDDDAKFTSNTIIEAHNISIQLGAVVSTILELGVRQESRQCLASEFIQVLDILEDSINLNQGIADSKKIKFERTWDESYFYPNINASPKATRIILNNIVQNAVCHAVPGSVVVFGVAYDHAVLSVSVSNNCSGISSDDLHSAREPFWKSPNTHSLIDHSGLGLTIVDDLCQATEYQVEYVIQDGKFIATLSCPVDTGVL